MDAQRFQKGELDEMGRAIDALLPEVWVLLRRGFLCKEGGVLLYVRPSERADDAERIAELALAKALEPAARAGIAGDAAFRMRALSELKRTVLEYGERKGRIVSVTQPEERAAIGERTDDLQHLLETGAAIGGEDPAPSVTSIERARAAKPIVEEAIAALDETSQKVLALRFLEEKSEAEAASILGCGRAMVRSRERRVRRRVGRLLRTRQPEERFGAAAIDALIADRATQIRAPAITQERVKLRILRRTFQEEPAPFAVRVRWAIGAAAIAAVAWGLMFALVGAQR